MGQKGEPKTQRGAKGGGKGQMKWKYHVPVKWGRTIIGSCFKKRARSGMQCQAINQAEAKVHRRGVQTPPLQNPLVQIFCTRKKIGLKPKNPKSPQSHIFAHFEKLAKICPEISEALERKIFFLFPGGGSQTPGCPTPPPIMCCLPEHMPKWTVSNWNLLG